MTSDALPVPDFDREVELGELLATVDLTTLHHSLNQLLGNCCILDSRQRVLAGGAADEQAARRWPVCADLEEVGWLETAADEAHARAAVQLLESILQANHRYRMAAELHLTVTESDYRALREKNEALRASETRYRELAENLEEMVQQQLKQIDAARVRLYSSEKLAAVGQLAAGVAHEINNPIGFMLSNLRTAASYVSLLQEIGAEVRRRDWGALDAKWRAEDMDFVLSDFQSLLDESMSGAQRVAKIVVALKDFSQVDVAEWQQADLNQLIQTVVTVAGPVLGTAIPIVLDLQPVPSVRCHPGNMNQLMLNLLTNAAQALETSGQITLSSRLEDNQVVMRVSDTGKGIAAGILPRVFDPFFTTRPVGQGTGLGLTVCHDIVTAHGGTIDMVSQPGSGTTVIIRLPLQPVRQDAAGGA